MAKRRASTKARSAAIHGPSKKKKKLVTSSSESDEDEAEEVDESTEKRSPVHPPRTTRRKPATETAKKRERAAPAIEGDYGPVVYDADRQPPPSSRSRNDSRWSTTGGTLLDTVSVHYPGRVFQWAKSQADFHHADGTVSEYFQCRGCNSKRVRLPMFANSQPARLKARNGRLVTDPDRPVNPHICDPLTQADIDAKEAHISVIRTGRCAKCGAQMVDYRRDSKKMKGQKRIGSFGYPSWRRAPLRRIIWDVRFGFDVHFVDDPDHPRRICPAHFDGVDELERALTAEAKEKGGEAPPTDNEEDDEEGETDEKRRCKKNRGGASRLDFFCRKLVPWTTMSYTEEAERYRQLMDVLPDRQLELRYLVERLESGVGGSLLLAGDFLAALHRRRKQRNHDRCRDRNRGAQKLPLPSSEPSEMPPIRSSSSSVPLPQATTSTTSIPKMTVGEWKKERERRRKERLQEKQQKRKEQEILARHLQPHLEVAQRRQQPTVAKAWSEEQLRKNREQWEQQDRQLALGLGLGLPVAASSSSSASLLLKRPTISEDDNEMPTLSPAVSSSVELLQSPTKTTTKAKPNHTIDNQPEKQKQSQLLLSSAANKQKITLKLNDKRTDSAAVSAASGLTERPTAKPMNAISATGQFLPVKEENSAKSASKKLLLVVVKKDGGRQKLIAKRLTVNRSSLTPAPMTTTPKASAAIGVVKEEEEDKD